MTHPLANALIVTDVQVDFCPGGSLPVENGDLVASKIHQFIMAHNDEYKVIVATKDWHPIAPRKYADNPFPYSETAFPHFSSTPDYVDTWPIHCVQGTVGANFHPNLHAVENDVDAPSEAHQIPFDKIFYKGQAKAAYSGFEGFSNFERDPHDEGLGKRDSLHGFLQDRGIGHVDIVGIATEKCVNATALDADILGYDTTVLMELCASLSAETGIETVKSLLGAGVHVNGWVN